MAIAPSPTRNVWLRIADLLLESDEDSRDWVSVPELRRASYVLGGALVAWLIFYAVSSVIRPKIASTELSTLIYRLTFFGLILVTITSQIRIAFLYFRFVLKRRITIRLQTILSFYFYTTITFGLLYYCLYGISTELFSYEHPPVLIQSKLSATVPDWWPHMRMKGEFILFSAFQTVNGSFYKIQSRSIVVSIAAYLQTLFTLSLISLFIAAYVNRKTTDSICLRETDD